MNHVGAGLLGSKHPGGETKKDRSARDCASSETEASTGSTVGASHSSIHTSGDDGGFARERVGERIGKIMANGSLTQLGPGRFGRQLANRTTMHIVDKIPLLA